MFVAWFLLMHVWNRSFKTRKHIWNVPWFIQMMILYLQDKLTPDIHGRKHILSIVSIPVKISMYKRYRRINGSWALFQYPKRHLNVRCCEVSKQRDLYLESSDRSEIWQAHRQHCYRCTCQISKRCDNLNCQSRGFEASRHLTIRSLIGYWNGTPTPSVRRYRIIGYRQSKPGTWVLYSCGYLIPNKSWCTLINMHHTF